MYRLTVGIVTVFLLSLLLLSGPHAYGQHKAPPDSRKKIALTFDDAPRGNGRVYSALDRTHALITALKEADSGPVAFFVTTQTLAKNNGKARITRYAEAGHLIANHSHTHQWLNRTDSDAYLGDIDQAEELLTGFSNRRPWFRFPYLDEGTPLEKRDAVREGLVARGLRNGYVTVDNYDWYLDLQWQRALRDGKKVDQAALRDVYVEMLIGAVTFFDDLAVEALGRSPAHVLLLHENDSAAAFIGDLIARLRADGWEIISPDEAYADPIAQILPQTLMTRQGHVGALAVEAGRDPQTLTHLAIEEDQIDALLAARNVFQAP